ncbi:helix-turn-helix domain-containing protein [Paracoccus liaowanqingii]|nr:helix-turn-helix domain-containing protein [Paracoccus liaowanqingii]
MTEAQLRKHYRDLLRAKPSPVKTLRNAIQDMRPLDALEYVLAIYEDVAGGEDEVAEASRAHKLTAAQAAVFVLLRRHLGEVVSLEALAAIQEAARPNQEACGSDVTRARMTELRKRLAGRYRIENVRGAGYVLQEA